MSASRARIGGRIGPLSFTGAPAPVTRRAAAPSTPPHTSSPHNATRRAPHDTRRLVAEQHVEHVDVIVRRGKGGEVRRQHLRYTSCSPLGEAPGRRSFFDQHLTPQLYRAVRAAGVQGALAPRLSDGLQHGGKRHKERLFAQLVAAHGLTRRREQHGRTSTFRYFECTAPLLIPLSAGAYTAASSAQAGTTDTSLGQRPNLIGNHQLSNFTADTRKKQLLELVGRTGVEPLSICRLHLTELTSRQVCRLRERLCCPSARPSPPSTIPSPHPPPPHPHRVPDRPEGCGPAGRGTRSRRSPLAAQRPAPPGSRRAHRVRRATVAWP